MLVDSKTAHHFLEREMGEGEHLVSCECKECTDWIDSFKTDEEKIRDKQVKYMICGLSGWFWIIVICAILWWWFN